MSKSMFTRWKFGLRETLTLRMDPAEVSVIANTLHSKGSVSVTLDGKRVRIFAMTLVAETSGDSCAIITNFDVTNDE